MIDVIKNLEWTFADWMLCCINVNRYLMIINSIFLVKWFVQVIIEN